MAEPDIDAALKKARAFFDRAEQVAATDNFDYAIDMYLEGLKRAPDALEDGHIALRRNGLIRQGKGGKKPSVVDKVTKRGGKTPLEEMLNAEYLLAKDPDNLGYAEAVMKAALAGGWRRTAEWMADLVFSGLKNQDKPNVSDILTVKDCYVRLELFEKAVNACALASRTKPGDGVLADEVKNLSAKAAMVKGKYDQAGGFRGSIRDREAQDKLHAQETVVKSEDYRLKAVAEAREKLENEPDSFTNRMRLCDSLVGLGSHEAFAEAVSLLNSYYAQTQDFGYKRHQGEIEIKFYRSKLARVKKALESDPENEDLKKKFHDVSDKVAHVEFEHYKACVKNYPTDLKFRYELGLRYLYAKRFDEAIPLLQEARREPRLRFNAMDKIGICFFNKGWFEDAVDIFKEAIDNYEHEEDSLGKEMRYNLARSLESGGREKEALEIYRRLAQIDYSYRDVRKRIDGLRADYQ